MAKRLKTKIGDIFSVPINEKEKRYMQLIAYDVLQLNSDVVRCFNHIFPLDNSPTIDEIINDDVLFYAHCATDFGLKLNLWTKESSSENIGSPEKILFRSTKDYGTKVGDKPIRKSDNWHVWHINSKDFNIVGKLEGENQNSFIGLVFNPHGILELVKGNKYPINYPDYE
ncbi:hypothetical protein GR160_09505 [Flavobacterium sp. Sd200]|uniref:hypothetical protein n=1 Tax=Flavobacterium sp. Sd200 TaxID=2692211 RepID=UPI00136FB4B5|nr:hypothetical protein [Flavobacterium sp. Sd200]MXN91464.1 hypothetical protein [Flavobacterium sp. Sd200]